MIFSQGRGRTTVLEYGPVRGEGGQATKLEHGQRSKMVI